MCKQYSLTADIKEIQDRFSVDKVAVPYKARYNISPRQHVPVIVSVNGELVLDEYRWGFVPFWARDAVNADGMSVHQDPAYRKIFMRQRCIVPCSGFYYWKTEGKKSFPVRVVPRNREVFGIAGLYDVWSDPRGKELRTCTLLMTESNALITSFHNQMPVILNQHSTGDWMSQGAIDTDRLIPLLKPFPAEAMEAYPVTPAISNLELDESHCIEEMNLKVAWIKE
ncbi:SOS response-associated peptidase [Paenibacillus sp. UNC499MF]|uniref:SOS response-associated peptidase n=1 Tax=Paenibacillus sp. UNC499MF TaxID=1502751 RepID=UPI00089FAA2B|nr:SOS response-associated peptidase [Paenibacillus sp. UNC499MF]SEG42870.1 Putative SOS response-associated peptidase YedK [Paenibacillus sp. UNC499MF]